LGDISGHFITQSGGRSGTVGQWEHPGRDWHLFAGIGLEIGIGGKGIFFLIYVHKNGMFTKNEHQ